MTNAHMYPIVKSYQVFLACENCETDMVPDSPPFDINLSRYVYRCPKCDHRMKSEASYPFIRTEFDRNIQISIGEHEL